MKRYIWITTQFEGTHSYPDAPDEVAFLRNEHRHLFKVKIWIAVEHDDREIEFIVFKRFIEQFLKGFYCKQLSCEMISDAIYQVTSSKYPNRSIRIEVSEDGENGSYTDYE